MGLNHGFNVRELSDFGEIVECIFPYPASGGERRAAERFLIPEDESL